MTRSIFTRPILGNVISLTLNAFMLPNELDLLFRVAFPYGLKSLQVWYSTQEHSHTVRSELLAYRRAGNGLCKALELLSLTTARPLAANVGPLDQATLPVARSLLDEFLTHIHGREVLVEDDVPLELQGMAVWPAARDRGSDAPGDTAVNDAGGGALVVLEN